MTQPQVIEVTVPPNSDILIRVRSTSAPGYTLPMLVPGAFGIDVSRHQGTINWDMLRANPTPIQYVVMRATMGARGSGFTGRDEQFPRNWAECKRVGILRGLYHYYVNLVDPLTQADNLYSCIMENGGDFGDLPLVIDVEPRTGEIVADKIRNTNNLKILVEEVARFSNGRKVMIYTGFNAWAVCTTQPAWANDYPLWVSNPSLTKTAPTMPRGWSDWVFWQYWWEGSVAGIAGDVDLNRFKAWR